MNKHLPYSRADRIAEQIMHIVANAVTSELSDPRLDGVGITNVVMTPDLRIARVYFNMESRDEPSRERAAVGLKSAKGYFKRLISKEIVLKFMPEFEFFYDDELDITDRIEEIFDGLNKKH